MSVRAILDERGKRYGAFEDHAAVTQRLKHAMHSHSNWGALWPHQKEALEMIVHKIGRVLNGDPDYLDSWQDIVGYAQLEVDILTGRAEADD